MENILGFCAIFIIFTQAVVSFPNGNDSGEIKYGGISVDNGEPDIEEPEDWENEMEYGELFEGDMNLTDDQLAAILGERNVMAEEYYRWPNKTVPYALSEKHTEEQREFIVKAMKEIENHTCVTFKERSNEKDYVQFQVCYFSPFS